MKVEGKVSRKYEGLSYCKKKQPTIRVMVILPQYDQLNPLIQRIDKKEVFKNLFKVEQI